MREYLALFPRPARFAGIEAGACHKEDATLRVALTFPDTYEVGMSYLGHKILYGIINSHDGWWAERAIAPEKEIADVLRSRHALLCTLESDTPLSRMDCVAFAITHELCYTNVLYVLDLAGIPLRHESRSQSLDECPLVIAGGGALLSAEPLAPFIDLMLLGEGEESLPEALQLLEQAKKNGWNRNEYLLRARFIPGAYVPSFFRSNPDGTVTPVFADHARPTRRIMADMDRAIYPIRQVVPIGAIHNRISLEIARGCTRGCRFCHAGIVYRPARERSIDAIPSMLKACIDETGFNEVSLLSLSTGDFSGLKTLCATVLDQCADEQISLCLPSLRVGSIDDEIMRRMSDVRRTGMTLAPEAGSQRLRDVINKGISEEELIVHARKLVEYGWRQVKLYFMIGLPTETDDDLAAIAELCRKVRDAAAPNGIRLQVTASLSPFVPKPFTPFQWEEQIGLEEITRRISIVRQSFRGQKFLKLHWHEPAVSHLEGILSRAGRDMADVVEMAYGKGAIFCSWMENFSLEPWLTALGERGLDAKKLLGRRMPGAPLPWDHLEAGVSQEFLLRELDKAMMAVTTEDCRYSSCQMCGACDTRSKKSRLHHTYASDIESKDGLPYRNRLNFCERDQNNLRPEKGNSFLSRRLRPPDVSSSLSIKVCEYRIWHKKTNGSAWLSQLEMQALLERAMRRARIPLAYSRGFHPMPLVSFGRAMPVGLESLSEWFAMTLRKNISGPELIEKLNLYMPAGLAAYRAEPTDGKGRTLQAVREKFAIRCDNSEICNVILNSFNLFAAKNMYWAAFKSKKGVKEMDIRPIVVSWQQCASDAEELMTFVTDWSRQYVSPLKLVLSVLEIDGKMRDALPYLKIIKTEQFFTR